MGGEQRPGQPGDVVLHVPLSGGIREVRRIGTEYDEGHGRDRLVLWGNILLDGHNRYEICQRLSIKFKTMQIELSGREAAEVWIIKNQLARRNISPYQRSLLAIELEKRLRPQAKEKQGERTDLKNIPQKSAESYTHNETRIKAAKVAWGELKVPGTK